VDDAQPPNSDVAILKLPKSRPLPKVEMVNLSILSLRPVGVLPPPKIPVPLPPR
jgi:hypothetical protein